MGGGGVADVDLSHGAVAAIMSRKAEGRLPPVRRPVLQVADAPRRSVASSTERYRLLLSDGVHSQLAILAASLNGLVRDGVRRFTVVRVLDYMCSDIQGRRVIFVIQLEILQSECALIGCPTIYDPNPTQPTGVTCSGGLGSHELCFLPGAQKVADKSSCFPAQCMLDSSFAPRADHGVYNLQYGGGYDSVLQLNTLDAKMQGLSLHDHQNQRFPVITTVENFGPGDTSGSPLQPLSLLPSPVRTARSRAAMNEAPFLVTPVSELNPYILRWTIKARVTAKTDLKLYSNMRGPGKVFSFDLLDAQGGEIRVTCFNLQVDRYFDLIEVDKVYLISRGILKPAHEKYNPLNANYEISADDSTSIEVCSDDDSSIPRQKYNFRQISEIEKVKSGSLVDLLAVVTSVGPSTKIMCVDGTGTQKRTLQLKDMSDRSVEITLWGKFCEREGEKLLCLFDSGSNPVIAMKGCYVSDFLGRSLSTTRSTQLKINPDFPEAESLRQWYLTEVKSAACIPLSRPMSSIIRDHVGNTIAQIKDESLGQSGKPDFITVRATISHVNTSNFFYPACTLEFDGKQCNNKLTKNNDGTWYCNRCVQDLPKCEYRCLLVYQLQDHTGVTYATAFQEASTQIIGYSAEELFILRDQDEAKLKEIMLGVCWQEYLFKLRIDDVTFHGVPHVRCRIVCAEKLGVSWKRCTSHRDNDCSLSSA